MLPWRGRHDVRMLPFTRSAAGLLDAAERALRAEPIDLVAVTGPSNVTGDGGAIRFVSLEDVVWTDAPERYEAGSPNVIGVVALAGACRRLLAAGMDVPGAVRASLGLGTTEADVDALVAALHAVVAPLRVAA